MYYIKKIIYNSGYPLIFERDGIDKTLYLKGSAYIFKIDRYVNKMKITIE